MGEREYQVCTNCAMDTTDSKIVFDENGVCDHCNNFKDNIKPNWNPNGDKTKLDAVLNEMKEAGKGQRYDCLIGLSGGVDSSYVAYMAKDKWGLRPLIYTVDTGWNLPIADSNVNKIIEKLGFDVYRDTIDFEQMAGLQLAYFKSQVPYQDIPQDHCIFAALYNYAVTTGIKYVLTGGNYSTECVRVPIEWAHVNDILQIKDIQEKFGDKLIDNLPMASMFKYRLYYRYVKGMKIVKPLDLIPYFKKDVIKTLQREFDWEPYKNKHYESIFTRFFEGYWLIKKFGYDMRRAHYSSLILTEQMDREEALRIIREDPYPDDYWMEDMKFISNRMGVTIDEFQNIMDRENKTWRDYKSDKWLIDMAIRIAKAVGMEKRNFR